MLSRSQSNGDGADFSLLKEKVTLAGDILDKKLLPSDWVYDNVFHFSEDQYDEYRDLIREDQKRAFRLNQIMNEGNDPMETGKSYGTPHDLATLYGKDRNDANQAGKLPLGYNEKPVLGRPIENATDRNTQDDNFGKDRLGVERMKDRGLENNPVRHDFKGGSPLALESTKGEFLKNKQLLESINLNNKTLVFESENKQEGLLDERQIRE